MFLAIDVGNTNIVLAIFEGDKILHKWRVETHGDLDIQPGEWSISAILISSVVPGIDQKLTEICEKNWNIKPHFVTAETIGISINMDKPSEIGTDRLVNALAAIEYYQTPAIILDFGTATSFDVVDDKGCYQGGALAPGINLSLKAFEEMTAKLPKIEVKKPPGVIGKNTVDAMRSGIYYGYLGLIKEITRSIKQELGTKPYVIATGGLAPLFAEDSEVIDTVDPDLTLKALHTIYTRTG